MMNDKAYWNRFRFQPQCTREYNVHFPSQVFLLLSFFNGITVNKYEKKILLLNGIVLDYDLITHFPLTKPCLERYDRTEL